MPGGEQEPSQTDTRVVQGNATPPDNGLNRRQPERIWLRQGWPRTLIFADLMAEFATWNYWTVGSIDVNYSQCHELELYDPCQIGRTSGIRQSDKFATEVSRAISAFHSQ